MSSEKGCSAEGKIATLEERVKLLEARLDLPGWLAESNRPLEQLKPKVALQCVRCGGRTFKSTSNKGLQCAECDSLGPFQRISLAAIVGTRGGQAPEKAPIRPHIAERRKKDIAIRTEAHSHLQNGPAEQSFHVHTADDMAKAINALLQAAGRGKALQVIIQEAV